MNNSSISSHIKNFIRPFFIPRDKLIIFNFHQVSLFFDEKKHIEGIWTQADWFYQQIDYLKSKYDIVSLNDAYRDFKHRKLRKTKIVLTFDDGDKTVENFVIPYLYSLGVPATFFINTAYLDSNKICWTDASLYAGEISAEEREGGILGVVPEVRRTMEVSEYLSGVRFIEQKIQNTKYEYVRYINRGFLEELNPEYFSIGLHGHEHQRYGLYSYSWQFENLKKNMESLSYLENYIPFFAIPFGKKMDWNQDTIKVCRELGVIPLFANGGYNKNSYPFGQRIPADSRDLRELICSLSPFISKYN